MSLGGFLAGCILLGTTLGCALAAAAALVGRAGPRSDRLAHSVAMALVATTLLIAAHVIPLALGILTRLTVVVTAAAILLGARLTPRREAGQDPWALPSAPGPSGSLSRSLALAGGLAAAAAVALVAIRDASTALAHVDMVSFHLPVVADWIQSGSAWQITQHIPQQAQGAYPHNGDVVLLSLVLPWHSDFLVRFAEYPFIVVAVAAIVGAARELRCATSTAVLVALGVVSMPAVLRSAVDQAMPDAVLVAGFAGALLFLLRHQRTGARQDLVLAGVGLGLGFGTKWYGVSSAAVAVALWALFSAYSARRAGASLRPTLEGTAMLTAGTAVVGGFWLVRNLIETGNPVFPVELAALGVTLFDAPPDFLRERVGFSIAHYAGEPSVWREYLVPAFRAAFGPGGGLVAALAIGGLALALRRHVAVVAGLAVAAGALAVVYAITPYTALGFEGAPVAADVNARYAVPALIAAAAVAAWAIARATDRVRNLTEIALAAAAVAGLRDSLTLSWGETLAIAAVAGLVVVIVPRLLAGRPARLRPAAIAVCVMAVVGGFVVAFALARDFEQDRYRGDDPVVDYALDRLPAGASVGLAGIWDARGVSPILAGYGDDLERRVRYLGRLDDGMLWRHASARSLRADLRRRPVDAVVLGRARDIYTGVGPRERPWLLRAGYRPVLASPRLILFLAPGRASPAESAP